MTVNTGGAARQTSTPPKRSARAMFLDYVRKLRKHYDEALVVENEYQALVGIRYKSSALATIACSDDIRWKQAVADEQFAERLANTYGQVAVLSAIENLLAEQRNGNLLLASLLTSTGDPSCMRTASDYTKTIRQRRD